MVRNSKKKLVIFEINEFDYDFFLYGSQKYNYPIIKKFLDLKKKTTITKDRKEGLNLDPWVQWVSAHTNKSSKQHKIFRTGQCLDKGTKQIWDIISNKNTVTLWGIFNSVLRKKKNIDLFYPDPWSFTQKAYPNNLNNWVLLPRYYAKNYPDLKLYKTIYYFLIFVKSIFFSKIIFYLSKKLFNLLYIFFSTGLKSFNLYFTLDLISLIFLKDRLQKKPSDLSIIALNSFAHYQHNYWDDKKYEKIYFWFLNEMIIQLNDISKNYENIIIFNGFSQKKIKTIYYPRIIDKNNFFINLNINFKLHEPNMTTGGTLFFDNLNQKDLAIKKLSEISIQNKRIFEISNFANQKKIFYKFNLVFFKELDQIKVKKNLNKNLFSEINKLPKSKNKNDKLIFNKIINNIKLLKSTSKHSPEGIIFVSKKINLKSKYLFNKKFYNQKLFSLIIDIFKN